LVADAGFRGVVVLNKAKKVVFQEEHEPTIWSESGASLGGVARRAVSKGWRGLEWATTIPGTIGGAVVGNAGAHGMDLASCLEMAEILQRDKGPERWPVERLDYSYRSSWLKTNPGKAVVLSAVFRMEKGSPTEAKKRMEQFIRYRQDTQPSGANWGSMFKNPPGDAAGRLIEAAELKGLQIGDARVSRKHANFFLNVGEASAHDVLRLIAAVQTEVKRRFGVALELEIELMGEWQSSLYER
jgi:UDP-N-acetylmuramate dehydrogenase